MPPPWHRPLHENCLFKQSSHGTFDEYWQQLGVYAQGFYQQIADIPVLFMSNRYVTYVSSTLSIYRAFIKGRSAPQRLVMAPAADHPQWQCRVRRSRRLR